MLPEHILIIIVSALQLLIIMIIIIRVAKGRKIWGDFPSLKLTRNLRELIGNLTLKMSNDLQNSALHHRTTLYFIVYYNRKPLF